MSTDTRDLLFVYGTLKCCCNNPFALRLSREGIFVSAGNLPGRLYRLDWYPALVADPAGGPVHGEVWDIDASSPILTSPHNNAGRGEGMLGLSLDRRHGGPAPHPRRGL